MSYLCIESLQPASLAGEGFSKKTTHFEKEPFLFPFIYERYSYGHCRESVPAAHHQQIEQQQL